MITYNTLEGHRFMRVLTMKQNTTNDIKVAEKNAKVKVIHQRIAANSAKLV